MRLIVVSDSHKRGEVVEKILENHPEAEHFFFLGDHAADVEDLQFLFPKMCFYILSGNCDYFSNLPSTAMATVGGVKILYTHGHTLSVKDGIDRLKATAMHNGCALALYGHTHVSKILYEDGLCIVNPGSCANGRDLHRSYAIIDIENGEIKAEIKIL